MSTGVLDGVRVLDFSIWRPGPYATELLAGLGADVLKVEPPGGDPLRSFPDLFGMVNAGKRSIVLDLKQAEDGSRALELASMADVIVEGFRPGVVDRLGVGYRDVRSINPSVVYCSISGYGQSGPLASAPGHDLNYQALAGALIPRDDSAPVQPGLPYGDLAGGVFGALSISAALVKHPRGSFIDVSMADALASWTGPFPRTRIDGAAEAVRGGVPTYGIFSCEGGERMTLGVVSEDHFWQNLCDVLGLPAIRDLSMAERLSRAGEVRASLAASIAPRRRDELVAALLEADVPAAPVLTPDEMLAQPHFVERGTVTQTSWGAPAIASPMRFDGAVSLPQAPAPALDEHRGQGFD